MSIPSLLHVHDRVYLIRLEGTCAERVAQHALNYRQLTILASSNFTELACSSTRSCAPCSLTEIYKFDEMVKQLERRSEDQMLVFSAGTDKTMQRRVAFLLGCHLIMSKSLDTQHVIRIFHGFDDILEHSNQEEAAVTDCWRALHQAKSLLWLSFRERFGQYASDTSLDMEELIHYSKYASVCVWNRLYLISACRRF